MKKTNMRRGFTMIELIFVIVIIGILAAVAIPKLAMTRSDAIGAKIVNKLGTCVNDTGGRYMKYGHFYGEGNTTDTVADTPACNDAAKCFDITVVDTNGSLTIANNSDTSKECVEAQRIAATPDNNLTGVTMEF